MKKLEDELSAPDAIHATHDAIERMVVTEGHKILRAMLQQHYDLPASLEHDVAVKAHDRHRRERLRQSIRKLETLVGEVEVQRTLYQVEGVPYLAPLEGVLAMPAEKYSQEVRRFAAEESAKSSFDEVVELIAQRTGARVPKRQVEELTILLGAGLRCVRRRTPARGRGHGPPAGAELRWEGHRDAPCGPARSDAQEGRGRAGEPYTNAAGERLGADH